MFLVNNLFTIFSLTIIIIIGIQLIDFISNYDYIVKYVSKYSKWEFVGAPSMNFEDNTIFDPNTNVNEKAKKWRCISTPGQWIAARIDAIQVDARGPKLFSKFEDCNLQLYSNPIISQDIPMPGSSFHNILSKYDWSS